MKSILKGAALLSAAALIASCDSSSGGGSNVVQPPPAPQVSATGSGTKGIMIGSTVTVTDAASAPIAQTTTGPDGSYDVALENSTLGGNIAGPLTVTITGGNTICDFDNPDNSGNDCATGDPAPNDFVVFGTQYPLPATFAMRSVIPAPDSGRISHVTPLSELAVLKAIELAGATDPTAAQFTTAFNAIGGLVAAASGIDAGDPTQTRPANLANLSGNESPAALVLGGLSAAVIGEGNPDLATVITAFAALFAIDANGNVSGTGTNLGTLIASFARGLQVAAARSGNAQLAQAATNATNLSNLYTSLGGATVTVPSNDANADGAATRAFVANLSTAVADVTAATGAQGAGPDGSVGATEAFIDELDTIAKLSSGNATIALDRLSDALIAAAQTVTADTPVTNADEAADDDETTVDDGLTFTLSVDASGTLTLAGVSATWPLAADAANKVTISATDTEANTASAPTTRTDDLAPEATTFSLTGVTMTTLNAAGSATAQTFTGSISNTYVAAVAADETAGTAATEATDSTSFNGSITAAAVTGTTLTVAFATTNEPRDPTANSTRGTYTATFTFDAANNDDDLTLGLAGTIGAALQTYSIDSNNAAPVAGTVTRNGATDVNTLTDTNGSILTLTVTDGQVVSTNGVIGVFTEGGTQTATLSDAGVVTFEDGSLLLLPAIIFIPDNQ